MNPGGLRRAKALLCQSKGRLLALKLLRQRGFSRARKPNH
jgi:hypothetical protein